MNGRLICQELWTLTPMINGIQFVFAGDLGTAEGGISLSKTRLSWRILHVGVHSKSLSLLYLYMLLVEASYLHERGTTFPPQTLPTNRQNPTCR